MSLQGNATAAKVSGKIKDIDVLCIDAYAIAVKNGFEGTEAEWLASLKGDKGDKGERGIQGVQGEKGEKGDPFTYSDFTEEQLETLETDVTNRVLSNLTYWGGGTY